MRVYQARDHCMDHPGHPRGHQAARGTLSRRARQARDFFLTVEPGQLSIESLSGAIGSGPFRIRQFVVQPSQDGDSEEIRICVFPIAARDVADLVARMRALPGARDVQERSVV